MLPKFSTMDVGAKATSHASSGRVGGDDDRVFDGPAPGSRFFLQACPRASLADQVPDLMEGDEVRHLSLHRCNSDMQSPSSATAPLKRPPCPTACLAENRVF